MDEDREALEALSRALRDRLRWEAELGAFGFAGIPAPPVDASPIPIPTTTTATRPSPTSSPRPSPSPSPSPRPSSTSTTTTTTATTTTTPRPSAAPPSPAGPLLRRPRPERLAMLGELDAQVRGCTRCRLHEGRTNTVFGVGNPEARLCFVGEGPGRDEDLRGEPFVGKAGQLLDKMIVAMGLSREDVYICNVVKCRPPENRTPLPDEMATCAPFLDRQLDVVAPEAVVALGACAARQLLTTTLPMGRLRGRFHEWRGVPVMPTYHPAYLLRNEEAKRPVWEDLQQVMARLGLAKRRPSR